MELERVRDSVVALVPDVLVDPGAGEDLVGVAEEEDQQGVLLGGQLEPMAGPLGAMGRLVDANVGVARTLDVGVPWRRESARTRASSSS